MTEVFCGPCSEAGGAGKAIYHAAPACRDEVSVKALAHGELDTAISAITGGFVHSADCARFNSSFKGDPKRCNCHVAGAREALLRLEATARARLEDREDAEKWRNANFRKAGATRSGQPSPLPTTFHKDGA